MNHIAASQLSQAKRFVISSSRLSSQRAPQTAETRQEELPEAAALGDQVSRLKEVLMVTVRLSLI